MRFPSWLRPLATHLNPVRKGRARPRAAFRPRLEALEERTLLSNYTAGTVTDLIDDINYANAALGTNTITLTAAASSPYILDDTTGALPEITANDNLTINTSDGANATIERSSSASAFRLFTVDSGASLTLQNLTLTGGLLQVSGLAGSGGAIFNAGTLGINNCTLADNSSSTYTDGGGIYNAGTANVSNSTLTDNTANLGGGIGNAASATVNVNNSTLAGNGSSYGGGIFNAGTATISNSTFGLNESDHGNGIYNGSGGTCQLGNSIVDEIDGQGDSFTSQGHNLISVEYYADQGLTDGINGDIVGTTTNPVDAMLASLGNYGGPTQTMGLLPGSPAIGAGDPSGTTGTDQRGVSRNQTAGNDIGAFESQGFTITATGGSAQSTVVNTNFPDALTVTVTANNPLEPVDGSVVKFAAPSSGASATLAANSATVSGGSASVTAVANGTLGAYTVTASIGGVSTPADFSLTNTVVGPPTAIIAPYTPLATDASGNWTSPEGSLILLSGSFSQPGWLDSLSGVTFTWNVTKNGTAYQSGTGQYYWFTPDEYGTYDVTLDVSDQDGSGSVSQTIDVTTAAPTAHIRTPAGFTAEPAGALDPNFGTGGQLSTGTTGYNIQGNVLAQQPDGKIVSAGYLDGYLAIARYLTDGTPDPSFGQNGVVVTDLGHNDINVYSPSVVLVQPDGKILIDVNSNYGMYLLRLNPDGTLDTSFGPANTGIVEMPVSFPVNSVALQGDNILVEGSYEDANFTHASTIFVSRYTAAGTLDTTFGADGTATVQLQVRNFGDNSGSTAMAVTGGQIYLAEALDAVQYGLPLPFYAVARLDTNGNLDPSYGGAAPLDPYNGQAISSLATPGWALVSSLDMSGAGNDWPTSILVQSDGQALIDGMSDLFQFSSDGRTVVQVGSAVSSMIAQPDGKLLLAAISYDPTNGSSLILTRLNPDLTPDTTFGPNGDGQEVLNVSLDPSIIPYISSLFLQSDGNVVVAMDLNVYDIYYEPIGTAGSILTRVLGEAAPGQIVHEGDTVTLTGSAFDPAAAEEGTLSYAWSVTKDGAAYQTATGTTYQFNPTDNGTYDVTLTVTDQGGGSATDSRTFTVVNVPPTAGVTGPGTAVAGQVLSYTLSATDPSPVDQAAGFTYTVDWGDGTADSPDVQTFPASSGNGAGLTVTHAYAAAGAYTALVTATDKDGGVSTAVSTAVQVNDVTAPNLQQALPQNSGSANSMTIQAGSSDTPSIVMDAINGLTNVAQPVTIIYDLGGGTYDVTNVNVDPPTNVTLDIQNGILTGNKSLSSGITISGGTVNLINVTLDPDYPALTVTGGQVSVLNSNLTTTGNAPTLLVTGGNVTLSDDEISQTSTTSTQPAISVTGGTVNLGTATAPGNNTLSVTNAGNLVSNTSGNPISAVGDTFTVNGVTLALDSLSGIVFKDFNDDGQVDFGEQGIAGVAVALTGTDFLGNAVSMSTTTDCDGAYIFANLQPGAYVITETQPAGYNQGINTVGTAGGSLTGTDQFSVSLAQDASGLNALNYNFGEQPQASGGVQKGQTAGIGFWNNRNGQALIKSFNGGATSTQLAAWLADTLPHIFGVDAGGNALIHADGSYFTNTEVAARFQQDFVLKGVKLDAQVLATALSVYATNATLDDTGVAANYGFVVSGDGVGTAGVNVGSDGDAFGVANNTVLTVLDLLKATDALAVEGLLYNGDAVKRQEANSVYSAINDAGNIG